MPPVFIFTILQSEKFLNLAHSFPYDVKLRLLAHSRSFLANQNARNAIVVAENLLKAVKNRQVQKSDRINSDRQSGSDQLGSTRIVSNHEKKKHKVKSEAYHLEAYNSDPIFSEPIKFYFLIWNIAHCTSRYRLLCESNGGRFVLLVVCRFSTFFRAHQENQTIVLLELLVQYQA